MWNKSPVLLLRARVTGEKGKFRFLTVLAGYVLTGFLLGLEPLMALVPRPWRERAQAALDAALAVLWGIMACEPQEYLHVDTRTEEGRVQVELRTLGFGTGEGEKP